MTDFRKWFPALVLLLFATLNAAAQGTSPDCVRNFTLTTASSSAQIDNRSTYCTTWVLAYTSTGFTGSLALTVQTAPVTTSGVAGSWSTFAGSPTSGINPNTSVVSGLTKLEGFAPFVRVTLASLTGTGTVTGRLYGYRYSASRVVEGSVGGGLTEVAVADIAAGESQGAGAKFQRADGTTTINHVPKYDADGDLVDSGIAFSAWLTEITTSNIGSGLSQGNGTKFQRSTGSTVTNNLVKFDANGNTVDTGIATPATAPLVAATGESYTVAAGAPSAGNCTTLLVGSRIHINTLPEPDIIYDCLTVNAAATWVERMSTRRYYLTSDATNSNSSANTIADVGDLGFAVKNGFGYAFRFVITYSAAATTTGSRWSINGPSLASLAYRSQYSLTATSETVNAGLGSYDLPAASNAGSAVTAATNIAIIEGRLTASADGTVLARFASEISSSAITAISFSSYVDVTRLP